jgi:phosphinothricin acetyltransferase
VRTRLAVERDAEAIRTIYNRQVLESTVTTDLAPRSLDEQRRWLSQRSGAHAVVVAELDGEIVGFASLSPYRDRPAYSTTVEDSVYVVEAHQGKGVGRELLAELLAVAERHGFHSVMARIVGDHDVSIRLHTSLGFELIGVEREVGRKFGRWLDVAVLQKLL